MFTLRLFHQTEPFTQIEERRLIDGSLTLGRDEAADWRVADDSRTLSRLHCTFAVHGDRLTLRDSSSNGVFVGSERRRLPSSDETPLEPGETVRVGDYILLVEGPRTGPAPPAGGPPPERARAVANDASLMEAFCIGAGLDASAFSGEEPAQVMRRLGEVYQQMVVGLTGLMGERSLAKTEYQLERTTVRAGGNNPFRWASSDRVAVDLLQQRADGFLSGAAAVNASFTDLQHHLICTQAGARGAIAAALQTLDPAAIEESLKRRGFVLKSRTAEAWERYVELHAEASATGPDDSDGLANQAFRAAYEREDAVLHADANSV